MISSLILSAALTLGASQPLPGQDEAGQGQTFVQLPFDDAMVLAGEQEKLLAVCWFHSQDTRSVAFAGRVWESPRMQEWLGEKAVTLRFDADRKRNLALKQSVPSYPTFILYNGRDGKELTRVVGPGYSASEYINLLDSRLLGRLEEPVRPTEEAASDPQAWLAWANHSSIQREVLEAVSAYAKALELGVTTPGFLERFGDYTVRRLREFNLLSTSAKARSSEFRNNVELRLLKGEATETEAYILVRMDTYWDQREQTERLLDTLGEVGGERQQELRMILFRELLEYLADRDSFGKILEILPAPHEQMALEFKAYEKRAAALAEQEGEVDAAALYALVEERDVLKRDGIKFYEALLNAGRGADAAQLGEMLLTLKPNVRTYVEMIHIAHGLGIQPLVAELAAAGIEEHQETVGAVRQIQRATEGPRKMGVRRLSPDEILRHKNEGLKKQAEDSGGR